MKEQFKPGESKENLSDQDRILVLYNDDIHTFDYVITALMEVCDHDSNQAEQCALITHFKGNCDVKRASGEAVLAEMKEELLNRGLIAKIHLSKN